MFRSIRVFFVALALCAVIAPATIMASANHPALRPHFGKEVIVMFSGGTLREPIVISDSYMGDPPGFGLMPWFGCGCAEVGRLSDLAGRSSIQVALFEGPDWQNNLRPPAAIADLKPEQTDERGRFFSAYAASRAYIQFDPAPWLAPTPRAPLIVPDAALALLAKHGVPVRISELS
jgi:hypothetical protein